MSNDEVSLPELPEVSVTELMERDPLKLSNQDLDTIIAHFRQQRVDYLQGDQAAGNKRKAAAKPKVSEADKQKAQDLLNDLGI